VNEELTLSSDATLLTTRTNEFYSKLPRALKDQNAWFPQETNSPETAPTGEAQGDTEISSLTHLSHHPHHPLLNPTMPTERPMSCPHSPALMNGNHPIRLLRLYAPSTSATQHAELTRPLSSPPAPSKVFFFMILF